MRCKTLIVWIASALLPLCFGISSLSASESRFDERNKYQQALRYLQSGQRSRFLELKQELANYPLEPYLAYSEITRRLRRHSYKDIAAFRERYKDTPLANSLMQNWLYTLGKRGRWEDYLKYFDPSLRTTILTCFELTALHKTGRSEEAFAQTQDIWLVDRSQPDECDAILKAWRDAGHLSRDLAWQRFNITMKANRTSLASYLTRFLHHDDKPLAATMRQVHRDPALLKRQKNFKRDNEKTRDVILHGVRRFARRDASQAVKLWQDYLKSKSFSATEQNETYSYIAKRLAAQFDPNGLIDAIPINLRSNPELLESRTRLALHNGDWNQTLVMINAMPQERQQHHRWRYWKARVLTQSADRQDQLSGTAILRDIAQYRDFYGFLAADLLGESYQLQHSSLDSTAEQIARVASLPGLQRSLELFVMENKSWARREWRYSTRDFSPEDLQIAARLAQNQGWYEQAIKTIIRAEVWDDLNIRFPLAFHEYFLSNARTWDIPLNWSLAIARQESAFMPDAKSSAGALGIMQVMPATARHIAKGETVRYRTEHDLIDPVNSIKLGSIYLGQMLRRFNNNRILASAAYNAGPNRVEGWLNNTKPLDVWIETIPFSETRKYVQNVLLFSVIYSHQMDDEQPLIYPSEFNDFAIQQFSLQHTPLAPEGAQ